MPEESTTGDLVERVRQSVGPMNRRDFDAVIAFYASDAVWDASSVGLTFEGAAAIRGFLEDWLANYSEWENIPQEVHDLGSGVTFMVALQHGRLAGSFASVQEQRSYTTLWEAGLISRVILRTDIDEARAAAERLSRDRTPATPDVFELMRFGFEAFNRRDFDMIARIFAADAVYDLSSAGLGVYEGLAAIRGLFEDWWSGYEELEGELEEVVDLGSGIAFVVILQKGRPVGSTGVVQLRQGWVMAVVDGLIVRVTPDEPDLARAAAERLAQERG